MTLERDGKNNRNYPMNEVAFIASWLSYSYIQEIAHCNYIILEGQFTLLARLLIYPPSYAKI